MTSEMEQLTRRYETAMGSPPSAEAVEEMERHVERRGAHFVAYCLAEARRRKARSWSYVRSILRNQDEELIAPETPMPHSIPEMLDDEDCVRRTSDDFLECLDTYAALIGERLAEDDLQWLLDTFNERGVHWIHFLIVEAGRRGQRRMSYLRSVHDQIADRLPVIDRAMFEDAMKAYETTAERQRRAEDVVPFEVLVTEDDESVARESES